MWNEKIYTFYLISIIQLYLKAGSQLATLMLYLIIWRYSFGWKRLCIYLTVAFQRIDRYYGILPRQSVKNPYALWHLFRSTSLIIPTAIGTFWRNPSCVPSSEIKFFEEKYMISQKLSIDNIIHMPKISLMDETLHYLNR